jgi:hypothetical protein
VVVRHTRPVVVRHVEYRRPVRVHRPYRAYRPHRYYRQAYMGPRCRVRPERVWTAYGWATRPVRVCRY